MLVICPPPPLGIKLTLNLGVTVVTQVIPVAAPLPPPNGLINLVR